MKLFLFLLTIQSIFSIDVYKYNGEAFDLKSGKKLYSDFHEEYSENGKHLYSIINYKDTSGKIFAKKKINFQKNGPRADFKLEDSRDGYMEGAEVTGNKIKFFFRKNSSEEEKTETIDSPPNAVLDGGFDIYMKNNWDDINAGKKKVFSICAPSQMDCFKFVAFKVKDQIFQNKNSIQVKIELNNVILAAFVKPIIINYETETKRILQYDGISNINNENGKSYVVKITYSYPN